MSNKSQQRKRYSAAIKLEVAKLVLDQNYTQEQAARSHDVGVSTVSKWVSQLRNERAGNTPKQSAITPEQIEIQELKKKIKRIELEKEILKKATVDSTCQRNTISNYLFRCFKVQTLSWSII